MSSTPAPSRSRPPRRTLVEELLATPSSRVITVMAPSGSGKSDLVRQWLQRSPVRSCLIPLGPVDNSAGGLAARVVRCLAEQDAPLDTLKAWMATADPSWPDKAMPDLLSALRGHHGILAFDNVHALTDPVALNWLSTFIEHLPEHITLALIGRELPRLRLEKRAVAGTLLRITDRHLGPVRPTRPERNGATGPTAAAPSSATRPHTALLASLHDLPILPPAVSAAIEALAVTGEGDLTRDEIVGDHDVAYVLDWLRDNPVPGIEPSEHSGRITLSADLAAKTARRVQQEEPKRFAALCERAAEAYEVVFDLARAFEVRGKYVSSEERASYAAFYGASNAMKGDVELNRRWLRSFTEAERERDYNLLFTAAMTAASEGHFAECAAYLEKHAHLARSGASVPLEAVEAADILRDFIGVDRLDAGSLDGQLRGASGQWSVFGEAMLSLSAIGMGDLTEAEATFRALAPFAREFPVLDASRVSGLATLMMWRGGKREAYDAITEFAATLPPATREMTMIFPVDCTLAQAAALVGEKDEAQDALARGRTKLARIRSGIPEMRLLGLLGLAEAALLLGELAAADRLTREAAPLVQVVGPTTHLAERHRDLLERQPGLRFRPSDPGSLSNAEIQVLRLLASHLPVPRIAEELHLSASTVRSHTRSCFRKLGVHSRSELVDAARAAGLLRH